MKRRELLHRTGALATVAGLAGCLGSSTGGLSGNGGQSAGDTTGNTTDGGQSETTRNGDSSFAGVESADEEPFRTVAIGTRDDVQFAESNRPRRLLVWNATDSSRSIQLSVGRSSERLFEERIEFAADAYLGLVLNEPADYSVSLRVSVSTSEGSSSAEATAFHISRESFDCNSATTHIGVMVDGKTESRTVSTKMACPGPNVADTSFQAETGECGKRHSATVTYGTDDRVRVSGEVRTPTPQTPVGLAGTSYDPDTDTLTVRVKTEQSGSDSETGVGTQCIGEVPYRATVSFGSEFPGTVVVVHETNEGSVEVASQSVDG